MNKIFIIGSGTGVGKTVLALFFVRALAAAGHPAAYYKWIQTGTTGPADPDDDAGFVVRFTKGFAGDISAGWRLKTPKAPLYAARDSAMALYPDELLLALAAQADRHPVLVAEAAGGLMVPLTQNCLLIDLLPKIVDLGFKLVLAGPAGLGTINHTLLSLEALARRGLKPSGLFLLDQPGQPVDPNMLAENQAAIEHFGGVAVNGFVPVLDNFTQPPTETMRAIQDFLNSQKKVKA